MHLRWLAKIELRGTSPQVLNIIVNYCGTRVLLYAKMLKETEIEKTTRFFVMFLSLVAFQLRGRPPLPLDTLMGTLRSGKPKLH